MGFLVVTGLDPLVLKWQKGYNMNNEDNNFDAIQWCKDNWNNLEDEDREILTAVGITGSTA
jgi:hypothetical protein